LIADLVRWRVPIREVYIAAEPDPDPALTAVAERVWLVERSVLDAIAPTRHPQGQLAVVDEPEPSTWSAAGGMALYLEGVQDPGNLGAIVRSATALGCQAVLMAEGCSDPYHPSAVRASAGAVLRIQLERDVAVDDATRRVRDAGGEAWATGSGGVEIGSWRPKPPTLILLGSEGAGLTEAGIASADGVVTIPVDNGIDSLNVAVAAGILLQHLRSLS
jgi:TrmH family RNA methyltransferase